MNTTFEDIMNFLTKKIIKVSTIVGSFSYNILAAISYKLLDIENKIYALILNQTVDTADSKSLDQLAGNYGIIRKKATSGILIGEFDAICNIGDRFSNNDIVWVITSYIKTEEYYYYYLTSEDVGLKVNKCSGDLNPITYVADLTISRIVEITTLGEDEETDDELRQRYKDSFNKKEFAGNKQSYITYISDIPGVGGVKVYPIWNGGGTVKIVITDSLYSVPSDNLVQEVQEKIDPSKNGQGIGQAPIGAIVSVFGAINRNIQIGINCEYKTGTFEDWENDIKDIINNYFNELSKNWQNEISIIIRKSELISRLIAFEQILDVIALSINNQDDNLTIADNELPYLESVGVIND